MKMQVRNPEDDALIDVRDSGVTSPTAGGGSVRLLVSDPHPETGNRSIGYQYPRESGDIDNGIREAGGVRPDGSVWFGSWPDQRDEGEGEGEIETDTREAGLFRQAVAV